MKNKKTIILLLLIAIVGVVGLTLAYFANTASVENIFTTKQYGTTVEEVFESPENWTPGTTTDKTLTVTNSGQVDEAVRVSYTESWTSKKGDDLSLTQGDNRAAIINWANTSDWTTVTENGVEYRYYNYKLAPGETTSTLLDSVTFNSAITNSSNCVTEETATGKTVTCTSTGNGYDGATYKLVFKVETVQYDKYGEAWGTEAVIANTSKPAPVVQTGAQKLLSTATNDSSITSYNDALADKGKMFAFSHPQTDQMKATTDYRYIGNQPNNYVYFNCNSVNNQSSETCEIWRIIGVFEVDDGTGNYETRIKLVRGSALSEVMQWDSNNVNDWTNSSLELFLNGDYLNATGDAVNFGLKQSAQNFISNAKYYLGEYGYWSETTFDIENLYFSERQNQNTYNPTFWIGKIALMYSSDAYMVYSYGVDDGCFSNPYFCNEFAPTNSAYKGNVEHIYPDSSWIYNSNILDGQYSINNTWLLAIFKSSKGVYDINQGGELGYNQASYGGANSAESVRPVVYLKSSIQITGGDGSEQHPYELSL